MHEVYVSERLYIRMPLLQSIPAFASSVMSVDQENSTLSFNERIGLLLIVESACLSLLAVFSLLSYIAYSFVTIKPGASRHWNVSTHIHLYFVNLLVCDLIQAIGGILDIQWIIDGGVTEGALCTAQGMLKQIGDVGVALSSLAIALHTFFVLVLRKHAPPGGRTAILVLAIIWIFIALIVGVTSSRHKGQDYYGNTQYWCWITQNFPAERIALEYVWLWLTAAINLFCYVGIALVVKGFIFVDGSKLRVRRRSAEGLALGSSSFVTSTTRSESVQSNAIAMQMLFYPAVYTVTVLPIAVVRWISFSGKSVPFAATTFSSILFSLSGLFNVLLFRLTRPKLLPQKESLDLTARRAVISIQSPRHSQWNGRSPTEDPEDFKMPDWKFVPQSPSSSHNRPSIEGGLHIPSRPASVA
ncbi:hypothetical protein C8J56DRAFT_301113 [Mycena floridula]|nr:hypothetical protein C8J56DRAFT_301113 [Mycena floridula]